MKKLKKHSDLRNSLITEQDFKITSLEIAEILGQEHDYILRRLRSIEMSAQCAEVFYLDKYSRKQPLYLLDEKAFFIFISKSKKLGDKVIGHLLDLLGKLKSVYENERKRQIVRQELKELTRPNNDIYKAQLEKRGTTPKFYHYSNKENLLMKAVTGYSATEFKKFLKDNLIAPPKNIIVRDFLTKEVIAKLKKLNFLFTELVELDYKMSEIKDIMRIKSPDLPIYSFIDSKHKIKPPAKTNEKIY